MTLLHDVFDIGYNTFDCKLRSNSEWSDCILAKLSLYEDKVRSNLSAVSVLERRIG